MHPLTRANQDLYIHEDIHYVTRCQIDGCPDDIIPDPDGMSRYCFKHYNYEDR
jgi:ribosomal protein S14